MKINKEFDKIYENIKKMFNSNKEETYTQLKNMLLKIMNEVFKEEYSLQLVIDIGLEYLRCHPELTENLPLEAEDLDYTV